MTEKVRKGDEAVNWVLAEMKRLGFYNGSLDAALGPQFYAGWGKIAERVTDALGGDKNHTSGDASGYIPLPFGRKVSKEFKNAVISTASRLGMDPADLMVCMAFETGATFSPSIRNGAGSGATGLIQFMPSTALPYFYTAAQIAGMTEAQKKANGRAATDRLAAMSAVEQLSYVERYFQPYKGRLKNLGDVYMAILWPAGVGKSDSFVLWDKASRPTTYRQNSGLDVNRNGSITRGEALAKINEMKGRGMKADNYG